MKQRQRKQSRNAEYLGYLCRINPISPLRQIHYEILHAQRMGISRVYFDFPTAANHLRMSYADLLEIIEHTSLITYIVAKSGERLIPATVLYRLLERVRKLQEKAETH